jgi:hypothetical protein
METWGGFYLVKIPPSVYTEMGDFLNLKQKVI